MPSLIHYAVAALADLAGRRARPSDDIGMAAELSAAQLRPPGFAPPRGLDRHVSLRVSRQHGWRVYEMAPWGAGLPVDRLVYFHGGGYVGEINSSHWAVCRRMSRLVPARVHVPIYPVAPDATAETTVAVSADIVADIIRDAGAAVRVTLMGDSAGGGLALAVAQLLRDRGAGTPRLILIAPWLDATMSDPLIDEAATRDPVLKVARLARAAQLYAGTLRIDDPRVSPLFGSLRGLGPITVFSGTRDLLWHDTVRLRDRAAAEGVSVDYHEGAGLIHVFPILPLPEARWARRVMVSSMRAPQQEPA